MLLDRPADAVVLAADIGGTKIDIAVATLDGHIVKRERIPTNAVAGPGQALERLAAAFTQLSPGYQSRRDVAVGVVCPGVVREHHILLAPNLPGWDNVALASDVATATGAAHVVVTNDVKAGALAELRFGGLRGADPGLYLNLGTGLACALIVDGKVVDGAHHAAGEIGYVRPGGTTALAGPRNWAALEDLVGGRAIGDRAAAVIGPAEAGEDLFRSGDPVGVHLVHAALAELATAVSNLCIALDPATVVVGGGMMAAADVILPVLRAHLDHAVPFPPVLQAATFTSDAPLHGAIALAIDAATAETPPAPAQMSGAIA